MNAKLTRIWIWGCVVMLTASCNAVDSARAGIQHSKVVSATLEKELGVQSVTGVTWRNGTLASVQIRYKTLPQGHTLEDIAEASREAVRQEFKQVPSELVLTFAVDP